MFQNFHIFLYKSLLQRLNLFTPRSDQSQILPKFPNLLSKMLKSKQTSFEWLHDRISSTDSRVRKTSKDVIILSGSDTFNKNLRSQSLHSYHTSDSRTESSLHLICHIIIWILLIWRSDYRQQGSCQVSVNEVSQRWDTGIR